MANTGSRRRTQQILDSVNIRRPDLLAGYFLAEDGRKVKDGVTSLGCSFEGGPVEDVALDDFDIQILQGPRAGRTSHQRPDFDSLFRQGGTQAATNESGSSGDQGLPHGSCLILPKNSFSRIIPCLSYSKKATQRHSMLARSLRCAKLLSQKLVCGVRQATERSES